MRIGNFELRYLAADGAGAEAPPPDEAQRATMPALPAVPDEPEPAEARLPEGLGERDPAAARADWDRLPDREAGVDRDTVRRLRRVAETLARTDTPEQLLRALVEPWAGRAQTRAAVFLVDGGELHLSASAGPAPATSQAVLRWCLSKAFTVVSRDLAEDPRFAPSHSVIRAAESHPALVCAPLTADDRVWGALWVTRAREHPFSEAEVGAIELAAGLAGLALSRMEARARSVALGRAREALALHHPPSVVDGLVAELMARPDDDALRGRTATICFCDVPELDTTAERLPAEEVGALLSEYERATMEIAFRHGGSVHRQLGHAVVAVFGAPRPHGDDATRAVAAALELRTAFDRLVARRPSVGPRRLRVGVDTGRVLHRVRPHAPVVLGPAVAQAAALQGHATPGTILIGAATEPLVRDRFRLRPAPPVARPGTPELAAFEILGPR